MLYDDSVIFFLVYRLRCPSARQISALYTTRKVSVFNISQSERALYIRCTQTPTCTVPTFAGSAYSRLIICNMLRHSGKLPRVFVAIFFFPTIHEHSSSKTYRPRATHKAAGCTYSTILYVSKKTYLP